MDFAVVQAPYVNEGFSTFTVGIGPTGTTIFVKMRRVVDPFIKSRLRFMDQGTK